MVYFYINDAKTYLRHKYILSVSFFKTSND